MSNYQRGAAQERRTIDKLRKMGSTYCCRVAGSRSEFDVVANLPDRTIFVQVKSTKSMPKKIVSILNKYKVDIHAMDIVCVNGFSTKELWVYATRAREPIKIGIVDVQFYQRI